VPVEESVQVLELNVPPVPPGVRVNVTVPPGIFDVLVVSVTVAVMLVVQLVAPCAMLQLEFPTVMEVLSFSTVMTLEVPAPPL